MGRKNRGIHLLGKHSNKKAVNLIKGIGKGAKGVAEEVYKLSPLGFMERNPMLGGLLIAGGVVLVIMYFNSKK